MTKNIRKFVAAFSLASLLVVVGGFCYAPTTQAFMGSMHQTSISKANHCHQQKQYTISQKSIPLTDNSVKPCCVDRHDKIPTTVASDFSGLNKIVLTQDTTVEFDKNILIQNVSKISSDTSPPKPDKLSSVLRLE